MKAWLTKCFGPSFKTALAGWFQLLCGGTAAIDTLLELLPKDWHALLMALCTLAITYGLVQSKDKDVSNALHVGPATQVITTDSGAVIRTPEVK